MIEYTQNKQRKLVELLYKKTLEKKIKWEINTQEQIYTNIAGRLLFVHSGINEQGEDLILFNLYDGEGKQSDAFNDETIKFDEFVPSGFDNWYLLCAALMDMAKRQATGADDTLDAMIDELDDDVPF